MDRWMKMEMDGWMKMEMDGDEDGDGDEAVFLALNAVVVSIRSRRRVIRCWVFPRSYFRGSR